MRPLSTLARASLALAVIGVAAHCSSEPSGRPFEPECNVNQFRACDTDACRAVEQCVEPGVWGGCVCTVLDANYADQGDASSDRDAALDTASDQPGEGNDAADASATDGQAEAG